MKFIASLLLLFLGLSCFAQDRYRYNSVHKVEENKRESYSIFYPNTDSEYEGVIIFIHSDQASNPKAYGALIDHLLKQNYLIIYPAYQDFVVSTNKKDLSFISKSITNAYEDIKGNYEKVMNLPVAFIGHSMGGIIAYELALGIANVPKKPSCVISLTPAEVAYHRLDKLNFNKIDSYDVYLIIEEEKDRYYRKGVGTNILNNLEAAKRKKYILHKKTEDEPSGHMNAWSYNKSFTSQNNSLVSYTSKMLGKVNNTDKNVYWPAIDKALNCAFSREDCDMFRE